MSETTASVDALVIADWIMALSELDDRVDDVQRIDQLRRLEELKAAAAAAQARIAVAFDRSQRVHQAAAGVPTCRRGAGVRGQVALASSQGRSAPRSRPRPGA